jgi:hypothetical protein
MPFNAINEGKSELKVEELFNKLTFLRRINKVI